MPRIWRDSFRPAREQRDTNLVYTIPAVCCGGGGSAEKSHRLSHLLASDAPKAGLIVVKSSTSSRMRLSGVVVVVGVGVSLRRTSSLFTRTHTHTPGDTRPFRLRTIIQLDA